MNFDLTDVAGAPALTLHGRLGVQQARPLWDALSAAIAEGKTIRLDASDVEEIDTSIAQILCRCGARLRIGSISDGFMASLWVRGLERSFEEQPLEPAQLPEPAPVTESTPKCAGEPARQAA